MRPGVYPVHEVEREILPDHENRQYSIVKGPDQELPQDLRPEADLTKILNRNLFLCFISVLQMIR